MEKKVSLAVAVYNVEKYLKRCLDSLLAQTYKNIEIILVDDCSSDNSLAMCYEYAKKDNRIVVIEKETHTVLSDVRNVGIEHATGEYIMFGDSDDYVCNTYVEDMVRALEEKNVDAAWCNSINVMADGSYIVNQINGYENRIVEGKELIELNNALEIIINLIILRDLGFDEDEINEITREHPNFQILTIF